MNPSLDVAGLAALIDAFAAERHCPSISWGVVADGVLVAHGASGTLDSGAAPTERTAYRIASMTKSFTCAAALSLRDRGVFALTDPIAAIVPELASVVAPTSDAPPVTVGHLMSMSSGLATDDPWADRHLDISIDDLFTTVAPGMVFASAPGTAFEYSSTGFGLLGRVIERASGRRVQDIISADFLAPLGMTATTWVQPNHDDWARPYRVVDGTIVADGLAPIGDGEIAPMGGLWTTVADLTRWVTFFDDAFPARNDPDTGPLRRASRREMQAMHTYASMRTLAGRSGATGYGYGLLVRDDPTLGRVVAHAGGLPGYGTNMRWLPGRRIGVIALANVTYAPMSELSTRMLDHLHAAGAVPAETVPVSPLLRDLAQRLVALLGAWNESAAHDLFTDNVVLDESFERRAAAGQALREACGGTLEVVDVVATTAAAGTVSVAHPSGNPRRISFEVSPLLPPRIQLYTIAEPA